MSHPMRKLSIGLVCNHNRVTTHVCSARSPPNPRRSPKRLYNPSLLKIIRIIPLRSKPHNLKPQHIPILRKHKLRNLIIVRIPNIKRLRLRDNNAMTFIKHALRHAIVPGLNHPIRGNAVTLVGACSCDGVIPHNQRFGRRTTNGFEPFEECREEFSVILCVPYQGNFVSTKVV